jgi:hypothetical protein
MRRDDRYMGLHSLASVWEHYLHYKLRGSRISLCFKRKHNNKGSEKENKTEIKKWRKAMKRKWKNTL